MKYKIRIYDPHEQKTARLLINTDKTLIQLEGALSDFLKKLESIRE